MSKRILLSFEVKHWSDNAAVTVHRGGHMSKTTTSYFATFDEAFAFCKNASMIRHNPSNGVWKQV